MDQSILNGVHYTPNSGKVNPPCSAAIVTAVDHENDTVSLAVLKPDGLEFVKDVEENDTDPLTEGTFHSVFDCPNEA